MYIENPEEEQNKQQSSSSPSVGAGGGGAAIGSGGTSVSGNPSTISPIQTNQPTQSFATIQDYLGANKPQGEEFGGQFISKVGSLIPTEKSAIDTATQNTQNQISSGKVSQQPDIISNAFSNPTSIANDQGKLAEFQKEYNAQYTGPSSFESSDQYSPAASATNEAVQIGQELGTTGGQQQLLQDKFGVYGQGNKGLDQTLLQNSSAYANIPPLAQNFQSVQDYLKAAANTTNAAATKAADETAATRAAATTPFANNLTNFQNALNTRTTAAQTTANAAADKYRQDFAAGNADQIAKDIKELNPTANPTQIQAYLASLNKEYGVTPDIQNFNNYNPIGQINAANVATPEEYANAAAYQKLTGTDYSGVLNPANIAQAGTYNKQGSFDVNKLEPYLKGQLTQQDKELLSKANIADVAAKLKMPDPTKNPADVASWTNFANTIIEAAQRSGTKAGFGQAGIGHETNPLGSLITHIGQTWTGLANQMGGNGNIPQLAGIKAANDILRNYFGNKSTATWS